MEKQEQESIYKKLATNTVVRETLSKPVFPDDCMILYSNSEQFVTFHTTPVTRNDFIRSGVKCNNDSLFGFMILQNLSHFNSRCGVDGNSITTSSPLCPMQNQFRRNADGNLRRGFRPDLQTNRGFDPF